MHFLSRYKTKASFVLELPARSGPVNVDGVEVRLIYEGGEITPRMPIQ